MLWQTRPRLRKTIPWPSPSLSHLGRHRRRQRPRRVPKPKMRTADMVRLERSQAPRFRYLVALVPMATGLLGVVIANIPVSILGGLVPAPLFGLVPVYFWCLLRPDLMTPAVAFSIGF